MARKIQHLVPLSGRETARLLGVASSRISEASHRQWRVHGYKVYEWADFYPSGKRVRRYEVPVGVVREKKPTPQDCMDSEEKMKWRKELDRKIEEETFKREGSLLEEDDEDKDHYDEDWSADEPTESRPS